MSKKKKDKLFWTELADEYNKHNSGRRAMTLPMDHVLKWAESRTDLFKFHKDGTISKRGK